MASIDGAETYTYLNPCVRYDEQGMVSLQFEGDNVTSVDFDEPYEMLAEPVEDGVAWATAIDTSYHEYKWESVGTVTVPVGTFDNCWKRVDLQNDGYLTYCRGVGRVKGGHEGVLSSDLIEYHLENEWSASCRMSHRPLQDAAARAFK